MATLVANNAEAPISRIELEPGINVLGRAEGNHHVIRHASVSSRHCEIVVHEGTISVRDLGSTNGTFIDDKQVQQGTLAHGLRLRLGGVEFVVEAPEVLPVPPSGRLRVNVPQTVKTVETAQAPPVARTAAATIAAIKPVMFEEPGFYRQIPDAFVYPFKKSGIILLVIGSILFVILDALSHVVGIIGLVLKVISIGYLFAYMQKIIAHSAQGEDEMPDFPDISDMWSDIILPFLLFVGTLVVSFLPVIVALVLGVKDPETYKLAWIPALALGAFYWPMALLAVAVTDNFLALSPHVVLPSIIRVFLPYLVTFFLLAALFSLRFAGGALAETVPVQDIGLKILVTLAMGFISLYLLTVEMRVLGLLFRSSRQRLGWI